MRILINFSDNDFYFANMAFLRVLRDAFIHGHPRHNLDMKLTVKERIVEVYNATIYGLYLVNQNQWSYEAASHIKEYLRISVNNVYINDEIDDLVKDKAKTNYHYNGEWFYLNINEDECDQMECW